MKIYHRTDIYTAYQYLISQMIWSEDGLRQANFHTDKFGGGSICKDEITVEFEWSGTYINQAPSSWPGNPNTLYWVPWDGNKKLLWSLVLFPSTTSGLKLEGVSNISIPDDEKKHHKEAILSCINTKLAENGNVEMTVPKNQRSIMIPELKFQVFKSKLLSIFTHNKPQ